MLQIGRDPTVQNKTTGLDVTFHCNFKNENINNELFWEEMWQCSKILLEAKYLFDIEK